MSDIPLDIETQRPGRSVPWARITAEGVVIVASILLALSLILAVLGGPTYDAVTNTLDAALASGEIELIRNPELTAHLADWRRRLVDTAEDELEVRRITNEQVVPVLARSIQLTPYFDALLAWSGGDPHGPGRTIGERGVGVLDGDVEVPASPELGGALALRRFFVDFCAADLVDLLTILDRTVEVLRTELGVSAAPA